MNSKSIAYNGLKFWICVSHPSCRFYLWEDHVVEALKYFKASEEDILKMTPKKRKRDAEITMYFPITPKTPRTRDAEAEANSSEEDIYELSDRETGRSGSWEDVAIQLEREVVRPALPPAPPSNARPYSALDTIFSESAPYIPLPSATLQASSVQAGPRPNTPPPTARVPGNAHALTPSPTFEPRTPTSHKRGRMMRQEMAPPNPTTPGSGSGRRKLSEHELDTYNVVVKALAGANVKLSVKGQNALRDIIKEEDFWIGPD
ncbi:hypothetical protein GE09DRAFT_1070013 [Coniochaeta sp. 2T2.1]|nr:hypothetical protein GE09DRAFT_1070013 [Coniochaeta sp. 2T2.1]